MKLVNREIERDVTKMNVMRWLGMLLAALPVPVWASDYPSQPITLYVGYAPGGNTDATARIFADAAGTLVGQPVIVDNRPGAGGTIGGAIAAGAPADGYSLLWGEPSLLSLAKIVHSDLSYDVETAYQPVSRILTHSMVFAVHPALGVETFEEFVEMAKSDPDAIRYGTPGVGTIHHFTNELLKAEAGIEMLHIPYQGNGPAMTDLLAGTIDAMFIGLPSALAYVDDRSLVILASTNENGERPLPNVPTFEELGLPAMNVAQSWYGVLAPAGASPEVVADLSEAANTVAQSEALRQAANRLGMDAVVETPEDFAAAITSTRQTWLDLVERTGLDLSN